MNRFSEFWRRHMHIEDARLHSADKSRERAEAVLAAIPKPVIEAEVERQTRLRRACTTAINAAAARGDFWCRCDADGSAATARQMQSHFERAGYSTAVVDYEDYEYGPSTALDVSWAKK